MNSLCDARRAALVVIDLQARLMPVIHEGEAVTRNAVVLATAARQLEVPSIGTAQYPAGLGPNVPEVQALCDRVIDKNHFDACAETAFLAAIAGLPAQRDDLIVVGCEAHVCVLQTVLGLLRRGHRVRMVADAVGSRQPASKALALERAKAAGAEIVTTEMVLFEWLRSSEHPAFKSLMRLIK